jgi:hypothetical protein
MKVNSADHAVWPFGSRTALVHVWVSVVWHAGKDMSQGDSRLTIELEFLPEPASRQSLCNEL